MADYKDLNLNEFLQPVDAPITLRNFTSSYQFANDTERGAVTTGLVRTIRADQLTAGTIVVPMNLGTSSAGSVILDGANNRIIVNDGTTNRILIGAV
jgi:hypothetical protein